MARIVTRMLFVPLALTFAAPFVIGQQSSPDLILLNGRIFTSDSAHPYVQAVAVRGDRIVGAGTSEKITSLAGPQMKRLDLGGRLVIPGINDAHYHCDVEPSSFQLRFKSMDPTWQEVADQLTAAEAKAPKGILVLGDIGPTALDDPQANRASLDKLVPDHPVVLRTWSRHAAILNTAGLVKFGVKDDEPDPLGGRFVRSPEDGKITGLVYEYAAFRFHIRVSELANDAEALQQTGDFFREAVRLGTTSVSQHHAGFGLSGKAKGSTDSRTSRDRLHADLGLCRIC